MTACPVNAITVDPGAGAKVVSAELCVGCRLCTIACPFGTAWYNPDTQSGRAIKCDLCGGEPACAAACPTSAIVYAEASPAGRLARSPGGKLNETYVDASRCRGPNGGAR